MKIIGLIGGISCESTAVYYQIINHKTNELLGDHHTARIVMVSLNFNEIVEAIFSNRWNDVARIMISAAHQLERAGVDFIVICSNTLYKVAPIMKRAIHLPLLHILDPAGQEIKKQKISKIGLLGTKFTMDDTFHKEYLYNRFQIESIIPNNKEREAINAIIFDELCHGIIRDESRQVILSIVNSLKQKGVQGVVFGCTELPLLLPLAPDLKIPIFDTTTIHANAIVHYALKNNLINKSYSAEVESSIQ